MIRKKLEAIILQALEEAKKERGLNIKALPEIVLERPKNRTHGDYSSTVALVLGSMLRKSPHSVAETIRDLILAHEREFLERVEVASPGFINFFLTPEGLFHTLREIEERKSKYGYSTPPVSQKIQLEFVSANPVGPLHLGHGRWAVVGDTLARVLTANGHTVHREFYVNDYGKQMDLFGASVEAVYLQCLGRQAEYPEQGYRGQYIRNIAQAIIDEHGDNYLDVSPPERADLLKAEGAKHILQSIERVLAKVRVSFDTWFSETDLHHSGAVDDTIELLRQRHLAYEKEEALWFRAQAFGDDKDRVLRRQKAKGAGGTSAGLPTYFAADVAYHRDKLNRKFDKLINIWGADHHGYVKRIRAAIEALGYPGDMLEVILGQLVNLFRDGKPVRMSKRTGEMVTLEELIDEVGADAVRFFFLMRSTDTPLDFDIDLAKKRSEENPVYYVQYAHARISSIIKFAREKGVRLPALRQVQLVLLSKESELNLVRRLAQFEEVLEAAGSKRTPHIITQYARDLATDFHLFYHRCRVIGNKNTNEYQGRDLDVARLFLVDCVRIVLKNALEVMGISAPAQM